MRPTPLLCALFAAAAAIFAQGARAESPLATDGTVARASVARPSSVRELLRSTADGGAEALKTVPPLWDWTSPATVPRLSQATPLGAGRSDAVPVGKDEVDFLDEVTVTATRRPTRQRDTTAVTYAVTRQDFRAQGAITVTDALQLVPGFISQPAQGGQRNFSGIFLRGFDERRFQLLRDGLSLSTPQDSRSAISGIPLDDLERIEVVTGGATLRYGSGAVGGVINLITETPQGPPKLTLAYEGGSYGYSRYVAKYGGGDDTFNYDLAYTSIVAFNNYPFAFTLPNRAVFYGPTVNANAVVPPSGFIDPGPNGANYPNGQNSLGVGGPGAADPQNNGATDLFGYLKPDVGPPITLQGINESAANASDNYAAKLQFKPDPSNRLTLRLNQRNRKFDDQGLGGAQGLGTYSIFGCYGGTAPASVNGTLNGFRFLPLAPDGSELPCNQQRSVIGTPTTESVLFNTAGPYAYNTSFDGKTVFPTGNPYPAAESLLANLTFFTTRNTSETEVSLSWNTALTATTSIDSYLHYYRNAYTTFTPSPYFINTNVFGTGNGPFQALAVSQAAEPFSDGRKFEAQTALDTQLSAGQTLSLGLNFTDDRAYQALRSGDFVDQSISRFSLFAVDDISFGPELKANLGFRFTSSSQFGTVGTPGVGLRYTPNDWLSLRANYSQVFNAPSISDLFLRSSIFLPNPGLRPETGVTYDVGADITLARNLGLRLTYFNTYLDGAIQPVFFLLNGAFVGQTQNRFSRIASGIEFAADWQASEQLRFRLAWTNTDARNYGLVDDLNISSAYPFAFGVQDPDIPFNSLVAALTYANPSFTATLLGHYDSGKRRLRSSDFVPAWATLDLNVEVPVAPYFTLTGNVFNLTDTHYEYFDGVPASGITFRLGGRLEFPVGS